MHISNTSYRIAPLTKSEFTASIKLLAEMFTSENQIWTAMKPSYEEIYSFMHQKVSEMLEWEDELRKEGIISSNASINFVYLNKDDEVVGVSTNFELSQYLRKKSRVSLPLFDFLEDIGHQLEKCLDQVEVVPGMNTVSMFVTVKKEVRKENVTFLFMLDVMEKLASQGFKANFSRVSNRPALKTILNDGGELLSQVSFKVGKKDHTLYYVKWPFRTLNERQKEMEGIQLKPKL